MLLLLLLLLLYMSGLCSRLSIGVHVHTREEADVGCLPHYFLQHGLSLSLDPELSIQLDWLVNGFERCTCLLSPPKSLMSGLTDCKSVSL